MLRVMGFFDWKGCEMWEDLNGVLLREEWIGVLFWFVVGLSCPVEKDNNDGDVVRAS